MFTNEEMEILNRSIEILSKYVDNGSIDKETFDLFERLMIAAIDSDSSPVSRTDDKINPVYLGERVESKNCGQGLEDIPQGSNSSNRPASNESSDLLFLSESYEDGCILTKYVGFDEEEIIIPEKLNGRPVIAIESEAFLKAEQIISIWLPENLQSIGERVFCGCKSLREVRFPGSLKAIGAYAFSGTALENINLPDSIYYCGTGIFSTTPLNKVHISASLVNIPSNAFYRCNKLTHVDIPYGVKKIGSSAFEECSNLSSVTIPTTVEKIEKRAFCDCMMLKQIELPRSVKSIEKDAFTSKHVFQPDRRYNPRTYFDNAKVTIICHPGSYAQTFARENGYIIDRSKTQESIESTDVNGEHTVYIIDIKYPRLLFSNENHDADTFNQKSRAFRIFLSERGTEWVRVGMRHETFGKPLADIYAILADSGTNNDEIEAYLIENYGSFNVYFHRA